MPPASSVMTVSVRSPSCVTVMPYSVQATARARIIDLEGAGVIDTAVRTSSEEKTGCLPDEVSHAPT